MDIEVQTPPRCKRKLGQCLLIGKFYYKIPLGPSLVDVPLGLGATNDPGAHFKIPPP